MDTSSSGVSNNDHSRQLSPSPVISSPFTGSAGITADRSVGTMSPHGFGNNSNPQDLMAGGNDDTNSSDDSGAASLTSKNTPIFLRFAQVKGSLEEVEQIVNEADMITAVEFDETGRFLATGDKGGRIVVFERVNDAILNSTAGDFTANSRRNRRRSNNHTDDDDEMMDTDNVAVVTPLNKTVSSGDREATYLSMHRTSSASLATTTSLADYNVYTTFQSHQPEFDYLKSVEIEEKINQIKWLKQRSPARFLLSTNDKTVKLWKLVERHKIASGFNFSDDTDLNELYEDLFGNNNALIDKGNSINSSNAMVIVNDSNIIRSVSGGDSDMPGASPVSSLRRRRLSRVRVPQFSHRPHGQVAVEPIETRVFANAHTYHINSISVCSDQETFMSIDDLRINLWHVDSNRESWTIVDMKPENMENLTEVITSGTFHPHQCHTFAYSSSKGLIRLCDMRQNALCDTNYKLFYEKFDAEGGSTQSATQAASNRSFFAEIIASIADVKFSHSGNLMCSRDYLWCKVWDLRYETRPLESYAVHEYVRPKLCSLYENDCIFDKFEVCFSYDDRHLLTGSYNNFFRIFDRYSKHDFIYEASRACVELQQPPMGLGGQAAATSQYRKMSPVPPSSANGDRSAQQGGGGADVLQQQQFQIASAYPSILKPKKVTLGSNRNVAGAGAGSGGAGGIGGLITGAMRSATQGTTGANNGASGSSIFPPLPYPLNEVDSVPIDELDFVHKKILHPIWHPTENLLAIATTNNLFLFTGHSTSALAGGDYYPSASSTTGGALTGSILQQQSGTGSVVLSGDRSYVGGRSANESSIAGGNRTTAAMPVSSRSPPRINLGRGRQG